MNMSISRRLATMIAIAVVALLAVGITGAWVASSLSQKLDESVNTTLPGVEALDQVQIHFLTARLLGAQHTATTDPQRMVDIEKQASAAFERLDAALARYEKLVRDETDRQLFGESRKIMADYKAFYQEVNALSRENKKDEVMALIASRGAPLGKQLAETLGKHVEYNKQQAALKQTEALTAKNTSNLLIWGLTLLGGTLVAILGILLIRNITRPVNGMLEAVIRIERDLDFTARAPAERNDEIGRMATAFNRLIEKLQGNLRSLADSAHSVARSANELSGTAGQVATASSQQSESASSMAASMEEMTVSISHVGDRAIEANTLSVESGQLAVDGEKVIGQTVQDINEISSAVDAASDLIHQLETQTQQISNVVQVIKEVADQTNLLALNAAIEAARAGEQGRGFAVVADEVRKLAERTGVSTQEITSTIAAMRERAQQAVTSMNGAVQRVSAGVTRAHDASEAISKIGSSSQKTVSMVGEITSAIREQSVASTSIANMVERIAQMAEESTAASQASSDTARNLDQLASHMQTIVAEYRL